MTTTINSRTINIACIVEYLKQRKLNSMVYTHFPLALNLPF